MRREAVAYFKPPFVGQNNTILDWKKEFSGGREGGGILRPPPALLDGANTQQYLNNQIFGKTYLKQLSCKYTFFAILVMMQLYYFSVVRRIGVKRKWGAIPMKSSVLLWLRLLRLMMREPQKNVYIFFFFSNLSYYSDTVFTV